MAASFHWNVCHHQDGNTCAHIAAQQGSVDVVRELMRHNRGVVINGKNRVGESTPLHLAAEGGHATLVKFLVENGASPKAENGVSVPQVVPRHTDGQTFEITFIFSL